MIYVFKHRERSVLKLFNQVLTYTYKANISTYVKIVIVGSFLLNPMMTLNHKI